jgi:protein phosphatase
VILTIADPSLVLLVGPSGGGKSTFARRSFPPDSILSSDELRAMIAGDANDQGASAEAFHVLALLVNGRLSRRLLTVVDATNLRASSRRRWQSMARRFTLPAVAISFDLPLDIYLEHNRGRPDRQVDESVLRDQAHRMAQARAAMQGEGWDTLYVLDRRQAISEARVELVPASPRGGAPRHASAPAR